MLIFRGPGKLRELLIGLLEMQIRSPAKELQEDVAVSEVVVH